MDKYKNKSLEQLFMELRFAPRATQEKLFSAACKLMEMADPEQTYPLEFVCFKLTEYRPREDLSEVLIPGEELIDDLRTFSQELSRELALPVELCDEAVYTVDDLARRFSVSTKTIHRWRKRGLVGRIFIFSDDLKRVGFTESSVEAFVESNSEIVEKAGKFTQLSDGEKQKIISLAREISAEGNLSREQVLQKVAGAAGRVRETIRYVLNGHDEENDSERVFGKRSGPIGPKDVSTIYKLYSQGVGIAELMERYQRSRSSIYRIINKRRARVLLAQKITYIDSSDFLEDNASELILGGGGDVLLNRSKTGEAPLLSRDDEMKLFRRYNYLKYSAAILRTQIRQVNPCSRRLRQIEDYLEEAEDIKNYIIEANLRLVMSIAGKHLTTGANVSDLVSEGNVSLMNAVEKFDYTRGNRFSTYATWAITKHFARKIPAEAGRPDKPASSDMSNIREDMRIPEMVDFKAVERAHHSLDEVIKNNLSEREQYIIRNHYALDGGPIKRKAKTLKEIGDELGVSKERVRQIELQALHKLRRSLSTEQFDLLTG